MHVRLVFIIYKPCYDLQPPPPDALCRPCMVQRHRNTERGYPRRLSTLTPGEANIYSSRVSQWGHASVNTSTISSCPLLHMVQRTPAFCVHLTGTSPLCRQCLHHPEMVRTGRTHQGGLRFTPGRHRAHPHRKTEEQTDGRQSRVFLCSRDDLFHHHEDHRPAAKERAQGSSGYATRMAAAPMRFWVVKRDKSRSHRSVLAEQTLNLFIA